MGACEGQRHDLSPPRLADMVASSLRHHHRGKHGNPAGRDPVKHSLCDGPCYRGVSHAPFLGNRPGALALGNALASDAPLQLGQLGLATHVHPTLSGTSSAIVGTLHDPPAFVLRQGAQESDLKKSADAAPTTATTRFTRSARR